MNRHSLKMSLLGSVLVVFLFGAGFTVGRFSNFLVPALAQAQDQPAEFQVFWQVWQISNQYFIDQDKLDPKQMTYGAIRGVLSVLGDEGHTRFLPPQEAEQQKESISGKFYGIGATVNVQNGLTTIVAPIAGSPADQAGIQPGDVIIKVDGEDVTALGLNETINLIRGEEGTEVVLTIYRPKIEKELEKLIIRGEIENPAATWAIVPGTKVGLIRLSQFSANLDKYLLQAIEELEEAQAEALIVDLRNNPGGLLDQCIKATSRFVTEGNVLLEEDAQGNRAAYTVQESDRVTELPVVVLINQGSASASEIFAGAIQDHERGVVIGETTFGTGTVLQPFDLSDGSTLLLGVSQWLTPQGRLIREQGIEPDIIISLPEGASILPPGYVNTLKVSEILKSNDSQLLRALDELNAFPSVGEANQYWQELQQVK